MKSSSSYLRYYHLCFCLLNSSYHYLCFRLRFRFHLFNFSPHYYQCCHFRCRLHCYRQLYCHYFSYYFHFRSNYYRFQYYLCCRFCFRYCHLRHCHLYFRFRLRYYRPQYYHFRFRCYLDYLLSYLLGLLQHNSLNSRWGQVEWWLFHFADHKSRPIECRCLKRLFFRWATHHYQTSLTSCSVSLWK